MTEGMDSQAPRFTGTPMPGVDLTESERDVEAWFKEKVVRFLIDEPWNLYPERVPVRASTRLADVFGTSPDRVAVTSGSTEALRCALLYAHKQGMRVHVPSPSYPGYTRILRALGAEHRGYDARTSASSLADHLASLAVAGANAVIVGSPGNPIGPVWTVRDIDTLCESGVGLVILDLTYALFLDEAEKIVQYEHPSIIHCLSLSKSHALAGARIGAMIAAPNLLRDLTGLQPDFPLDMFQLSVCHVASGSSFLEENHIRSRHTLGVTRAIANMMERVDGISVVSERCANFVTIAPGNEWWDMLNRAAQAGGLRAKVFNKYRLIRITSTAANLESLSTLLETANGR